MRIAIALLALVPTVASAQTASAPAAERSVTKAELNTRLDTDYADLDANKDGKVVAAEINARLVRDAKSDLAAMSKERDAAFARFDTDKNGSISRAEFDAGAPLPTMRDPDAKPFLERFDTNKDGAISKDEFRAPTMSNFERLDSNKDGVLSAAEQQAAATRTQPQPEPRKATASVGR